MAPVLHQAAVVNLARFVKPVVCVSEKETAVAAAQKLRDAHVGSVVVVRGAHPVGILTDRDLALRIVAEGLDPRSVGVGDIVTYDPIVVREGDGIETVVARMREHGIRRLPIVNAEGRVVGVVTADDLFVMLGRELADLSEAVEGSADACDSR